MRPMPAAMVPLLLGAELPPKPEASAAAATIQRPVCKQQKDQAKSKHHETVLVANGFLQA
jgi:hypothetical protein